jgi:FtsP/CotA-like multicopper oxidase with cupredoxin domain
MQKFSIDGHRMTVIATDYVPTVPYTTDTVTLGVAQRTDVLVQALDTPGATYWMRARIPDSSITGGLAHSEVLAAIYYEGADPTLIPTSQSVLPRHGYENEPVEVTQPEYVIAPSGDAYQQDLVLSLQRNSSGIFEWLINGQTFRANLNSPSLFLAAEGNTTYPDPEWNMFNFGQNRSIILNVTNATPFTHPFHLHGHNTFVLNVGGAGSVWDGTIVNPRNPTRRDTVIIPPLGWAALSFQADNPGIWPFHCHAAWHLSGGLTMNIMTRPEDIPKIPQGMRESTCAAWDAYTDRNTVDQIDAGS